MVLRGSVRRNAIPRKRAISRGFGSPEHTPRSLAKPQTCAVLYGKAPACPASGRARKGPRAAKTVQKCKKMHLVLFIYYVMLLRSCCAPSFTNAPPLSRFCCVFLVFSFFFCRRYGRGTEQ